MIKIRSIIILLIVTTLSIFAEFESELQYCPRNIQMTGICELNEAPSIYILEALFANLTNPYPIELWENRNNEEMNIFDIAREIKLIAKHKEKIFNDVEEHERSLLLERLSQMEDIASRALAMEDDKWKADYVNELMKHIIGIRNFGISDLLPNVVNASNCKDEPQDTVDFDTKTVVKNEETSSKQKTNIINPCDQEGRQWTSLGRLTNLDCKGPSIAGYMQAHGTDIQLIEVWWGNQVMSSWQDICRAVKVFYSNQRTLDSQKYYWNGNYQISKDQYITYWEKGGSDNGLYCYPENENKEKAYTVAFTIWHAYVQEILSKVKFDHNSRENKEVCLIRTNGLGALRMNNITGIGRGYTIPNAVYDSFALFKIFSQGSPEHIITEFLVPHHRIIHLYPLIDKIKSEFFDKHFEEMMKKEINFIIKNYYDENGFIIADQNNSFECEKLVEIYMYHKYAEAKKENSKRLEYFGDINMIFKMVMKYEEKNILEKIALLPKSLSAENPSEVLFKIFTEHAAKKEALSHESYESNETEFVVLSGPDLPFDYFYNTYENLSHYEKRLLSGERVCGFWPKLEDLKLLDSLGGSTGALLYENQNGRKYVLKKGGSEGHIREEALADSLYDALGCAVPENRLYETPEGPVKVAVFLENAKSLYDTYYNATESEQQRLRNEISKDFVVDALFCNFDVIGLDMDNVLVGNEGQVFRVNNGGSLRYRTQGRLKNDTSSEHKSWNSSPITLWTLRDPARDSNGALIFADVDIYQIADDIEKLKCRLINIGAEEQKWNLYNFGEVSEGSCKKFDINTYFNTTCEIPKNDNFHEKDLETLQTRHQEFGEVCDEKFISIQFFDKNPELKKQIKARIDNFDKVATKALEMKAQGITSKEADFELRKWVESQDWGPAFN